MNDELTSPGKQQTDIVTVATRTLLAAGYSILGCQRLPAYAEIDCERFSRLGIVLRFVIAITTRDRFTEDQIADINHSAAARGQMAVLVAASRSIGQISWGDFLEVMGGAVPSWRALSMDYSKNLLITSRNKLSTGLRGEAWLLFEDLVGDGLEFSFGRRVQRFGGHRRGAKVSDMIAQIPDLSLVVVDAKASADGFDASWASLRPLAEYVQTQKERQQGLNSVLGALVVSSSFRQDHEGLAQVARTFLGETRMALCFMTAEVLAYAVDLLRKQPDIRNAIRWKALFTGGFMLAEEVQKEIRAASDERFEAADV